MLSVSWCHGLTKLFPYIKETKLMDFFPTTRWQQRRTAVVKSQHNNNSRRRKSWRTDIVSSYWPTTVTLPVTYHSRLYRCVGFKLTDAEEILCHSRSSASNAQVLCAKPTIPFAGRQQTSAMAQCSDNANASSAVNGGQKGSRKVALITGITGQVR